MNNFIRNQISKMTNSTGLFRTLHASHMVDIFAMKTKKRILTVKDYILAWGLA